MSKERQLEVPGSEARRAWLKGMGTMAVASAMGTLASPRPVRAAASTGAVSAAATQDGKALFAYVGTYTPHGLGIHRFQVDRASGKLDPLEPVQGIENPS